MNGTAAIFASHRPRLLGIAHRMLGTRTDAEDVLQDAYLRWHQSAAQDIESPLAFLVTMTKRLCLDHLREVRQQRTRFVDSELAELLVEDHAPSPEAQLESKEEVSAGFLVLLERLSPTERAALLMHDVFDYEYHEVARILGKTEESCRQTVHRARAHLREPRARFALTRHSGERERLLRKFLIAVGTGDRRAVASLLAEMEIAGRTGLASPDPVTVREQEAAWPDQQLKAA